MATSSHFLKVMMLKNCFVRKHQKIFVVFEILWFLFLILMACFPVINLHSEHEHPVLQKKITEESMLKKIPRGLKIFYNPSNWFTRSIMGRVNSKLPTADTIPLENKEILRDKSFFNKRSFDHQIFIMFDEHNSSYPPMSFKYILKPFQEYSMSYIPFKTDLDSSNPYNQLEGFTTLQYCLDKSFMELLNIFSENRTIDVGLARIPYPKFTHNMSAQYIVWSVITPTALINFIMVCVYLLNGVVSENQSGLKAVTKILGVKSWTLWCGWLIDGCFLYAVRIFALVVMLKAPLSGTAILPNTNLSLLITFFALYCFAELSFCLALSNVYSGNIVAVLVTVLMWITPYFWFNELISFNILTSYTLIECLFVSVLLKRGCEIFTEFEELGIGVQWNTLMDHPTNKFNMRDVFVALVIDIILYTIIFWYTEKVKPGPYITSRVWYFPLERCIKLRKNMKINSTTVNLPQKNIEPVTSDLKTIIEFRSLRKTFGSKYVLDNFSMDIYADHVTVLLGYNGAGKTVLVSLLTRMLIPTSGSILIEGLDIEKYAATNIGFCLDFDILFSELTVKENLIVFCMYKGFSRSEAKNKTEQLLTQLKFEKESNKVIKSLSSGLKRKVALSVGLIGNPKILVFDHPTEEMDTDLKKDMWDFLMSMRKNHTIIVTTRSVEEACVLGDKICFVNNGQILCYGSRMYLKNLFGLGYHLSITRTHSCSVEQISKLVQHCIGDVVIKSHEGMIIRYVLPDSKVPHFPTLFKSLEENKNELGIVCLNVNYVDIEEVFVNLAAETDNRNSGVFSKAAVFNLHGSKTSFATDISSVSGYYSDFGGTGYNRADKSGFCFLECRRFGSLLYKILLFTLRKWRFFVLMRCVGIFLILFPLVIQNYDPLRHGDTYVLHLNIYGKTNLLYKDNGGDSAEIADIYSKLVANVVPKRVREYEDINNVFLKEGENNFARLLSKYIAGGEFYSSGSKIKAIGYYSREAIHSPPITLNMINNALLKKFKGDNYSITIMNSPFTKYFGTTKEEFNKAISKWMLIPVGMFVLLAVSLYYPYYDQCNQAKQLQHTTGVSVVTYWFACYFWDCLQFMLLNIVIFICMYFAGLHMTELSVLFPALILFGLSGTAYTYIFTRNSTFVTFFVYLSVNSTFGIILPAFLFIFELDTHFLSNIFMLLPQYSISYVAFYLFFQIESTYQCEISWNSQCTPYEDKKAIVTVYLILVLDVFLYAIILLVLESNFISKYFKDTPRLYNTGSLDDDIEEEKKRVEAQIATGIYTDLLTISNLQKQFKNNIVLRNVTFGISSGECFAILGDGKSVLMKILAGLMEPSQGDIIINGTSRVQDKKEFMKYIGYCPQVDAFSDYLTATENLWLFAHLRGVPRRKVGIEVNRWLNLLELCDYAGIYSRTYTNEEKRKLSIAIAMIGDPLVILLDEPTGGLDFMARRRLWRAVNKVQRSGRCIVFTSHDIQECEKYCTNVTIINDGNIVCVGNAPYLQHRYGQGCSLKIMFHLNTPDIIVHQMKTYIESKYQYDTKDFHPGFLYYHLNEPDFKWFKLFKRIESLKNTFPNFVLDYIIENSAWKRMYSLLSHNKNIEAPRLQHIYNSFAKKYERGDTMKLF